MKDRLKRISCGPTCGFMVQSHSEKEIIDIIMNHIKDAHPSMEATEEDLAGRMENVKTTQKKFALPDH